MKTPSIGLTGTGVLGLALVAGAAWVAWKLYKGAGGAIAGAVDAVSQAATQGAANVTQAWNNATSQPAQQTAKALFYSNEGYTGSADGTSDPTTGEWYGNEEARRYTYQQADAGAAPAAQSINGAAFGVYPSAGRRTTASQAVYQKPAATTNGQDQPDRPPVSFLQTGGSFKDLAEGADVNALSFWSQPLGQLH